MIMIFSQIEFGISSVQRLLYH